MIIELLVRISHAPTRISDKAWPSIVELKTFKAFKRLEPLQLLERMTFHNVVPPEVPVSPVCARE